MVTIDRLHVRYETDKQSAIELADKLCKDDPEWVYFAVMVESGLWSVKVFDNDNNFLGYL